MAKCIFLGVKRSFGEMDGEKKGQKITWDNAVVYRAAPIVNKDGEVPADACGFEVLTPCKIKMSDFKEVTGETFEAFLVKAEDCILQPMVVMFGEMKGAKDDRKADTEYLRFVSGGKVED